MPQRFLTVRLRQSGQSDKPVVQEYLADELAAGWRVASMLAVAPGGEIDQSWVAVVLERDRSPRRKATR